MVQEEPILSWGLSEVSLHKFPPFLQAHWGAQDSTGHILAAVQCPSRDRCDSCALPSPLGDSEDTCWELAGMRSWPASASSGTFSLSLPWCRTTLRARKGAEVQRWGQGYLHLPAKWFVGRKLLWWGEGPKGVVAGCVAPVRTRSLFSSGQVTPGTHRAPGHHIQELDAKAILKQQRQGKTPNLGWVSSMDLPESPTKESNRALEAGADLALRAAAHLQ